MVVNKNLISLENEIESIEVNAVEDEKSNAKVNFTTLDRILNKYKASLPYPEVSNYATSNDYSEIYDLQFKKRQNKLYLEKIDEVKKYVNNTSLYCGHLKFGKSDIYFMDNSICPSQIFKHSDGSDLFLVNINDKLYNEVIQFWRFPSDHKNVVDFSRNITLSKRIVKDVDVIYDNNSSQFSDVTDAYLRKALIRNKDNNEIQSIIQTIQKKQDYLRTLSKNNAFIVQGCAGSGKTMVLLLRLRYLIYNNDILPNEYLLLTPGETYNEFIKNLSRQYNINSSNVHSYHSYYANLLGKTLEQNMIYSELVFDQDFLQHIYSEKFIKSVYKTFIEDVINQANEVIQFCDNLISSKYNEIKNGKTSEINDIKNDTFFKIKEQFSTLCGFMELPEVDSYESIPYVLSFLKLLVENERQYIDNFHHKDYDIKIEENDIRIISDDKIKSLLYQIDKEREAIKNASPFTKTSHQKKLELLISKYEAHKNKIIDELLSLNESSRKKQMSYLYYQIKQMIFRKLNDIYLNCQTFYLDSEVKINQLNEIISNSDDLFYQKYENQINVLNDFINTAVDLENFEQDIEEINPLNQSFYQYLYQGTELISSFKDSFDYSEEMENQFNLFKYFNQKSEAQLSYYVYLSLFNLSKRFIKEHFNVKLSNKYKHFWYLNLYCKYLSNSLLIKPKNYIFIDEAQDLSIAEIKLITKLNKNEIDTNHVKYPLLNLYGDVNQTITKHGIKNWNDLELNLDIYTLNDNFRNTNQIIHFCNKYLPFKMEKVGIDGPSVTFCPSLQMMINIEKSIRNSATLIVKDDYKKLDLIEFLKSYPLISNYTIFTVKEVKGLEFKEVFIFNKDMTENEKYIAYSRALIKLNVVEELPYSEQSINLIFSDGDDDEVGDDNTNMTAVNQNQTEAISVNEKSYSSKLEENKIFVHPALVDKITEIEVSGKYNGTFLIAPYTGKIKKYTSEKLESAFFEVYKNNHKMYLTILIDLTNRIIYINQPTWKVYKNQLIQPNIPFIKTTFY